MVFRIGTILPFRHEGGVRQAGRAVAADARAGQEGTLDIESLGTTLTVTPAPTPPPLTSELVVPIG